MNVDFNLGLFRNSYSPDEIRRAKRAKDRRDEEKERVERFESWLKTASDIVAAYLQLLDKWRRDYAPVTHEEEWDKRFCEALDNIDKWDYWYNIVFVEDDYGAAISLYRDHEPEVKRLDERITEYIEQSRAS